MPSEIATTTNYHLYVNGDVLLLHANVPPPPDYTQDEKNPFLYHRNGAKVWSPHDKPNLLVIVTTAAKAFATYVRSGGEQVGEDVATARMNVCHQCDRRINFMGYVICSECKCVCNMKTKMPTQECPLNFWPATKKAEKKCGGCNNGSRTRNN